MVKRLGRRELEKGFVKRDARKCEKKGKSSRNREHHRIETTVKIHNNCLS